MCRSSWCHGVPGIWCLLQHGLFLVVYICHMTGGVSWSKQPQDTEVVKGQTARLECQVQDRGFLNVIWNKGGNVIFINNQSNSGVDTRYKIVGEFNLIIENATEGDDAFFSCAVFSFDTVQVKLTVLLLPGDPVITRSPIYDVYTENSVISLTCSSTGGNPDPTIMWYKNGQVLSGATFSSPSQPRGTSSSHISVTLDRTDNKANFTCAVFNKANQNQPRVKTQFLDVQYAPYINFVPYSPYYVKFNQRTQLECVVDSNPPVTTVQWRKNGSPLQATGKILEFSTARKSDTGNYSCMATNTVNNQTQTRSNFTNFYVIYAPVVTTPSEVIVNISQTVNITCLVDAYPQASEVRWENVDKTMMADGPNFVFQATQRFAGNYTCTAKNKLEPSGSSSEEITTSGTTTVRVQYPPGRASITPVSSVLVGGTVSLRCTVADPGYPEPYFEWQKVGESRVLQASTSPTYQINNAVLENNGNYTCTPKNLMGTGQSATIMLEVNSPPLITSTVPPSAKVTIPIEQPVLVLKHIIEGRPLPAVQWSKDGMDLTSMPNYYFVETNSSSVGFKYIVTTQVSFIGQRRQQINNNRLRIEDIGNYTCTVTSGATNTPVLKTTEVSVLFGPQITIESRIASNVGEMTVFSCQAQANPTPHFYWSKGGTPITGGDGVSLEEKMMDGIAMFEGLLQLLKTAQSDLGEYSCTVNNSIGQTTKKIRLSLKSTPDPPINLSKLSQTWESVNLHWEPGFDGGYNQSFVIYVNSIYGLREVNLSSQTSFNVTGLMPQTRYSFTVAGKNIRGGGNKSEALAVQTDALVFPVLAGTPEFIVEDGKLQVQAVLNMSYCLRVEVSKDGGRSWQKAQDCLELMGDFIPLALHGVSHVNVSICLTYRPEVCGEPVSATIREPSTPDLTETQVIIIGCVCAAVLVILLIVLVVIICKRRQRLNKNYENETSANRPQMQPVNGAVPTDKPRQGYDNQGMPDIYMVDSGSNRGTLTRTNHYYKPIGTNWSYTNYTTDSTNGIPMDTRNGYPPKSHYNPGESVPLDTSYDSQLEKQMYENEMNRRNANLNGDPYYNEKRGDLSFSNFSNSPRTPTKDPQQFINVPEDRKGEGGGGIESGYSTPEHQKPRKSWLAKQRTRIRLQKRGQRNPDIVPYAHDPPGHTCGLPCCGGDLHVHLRDKGRPGGCMSFKAFDAELGNFTLKAQRGLLRGNPSFATSGSFSLQPSRASTQGQIPEFGSIRGQSLRSNPEQQSRDNTAPPQNFLKGREITLPHSFDLSSRVIKKDYSAEEDNDFLYLDSDHEIEYYMSVPQNEVTKEEREHNESSKLTLNRDLQVKGHTPAYDSIHDSQSVCNYYETLTFERESFDEISTDQSVAIKDNEREKKATNTGIKVKSSTLPVIGRNSDEKWDHSTATLTLSLTKLGVLYGTTIRETCREEGDKKSKTLSANRKYPLPVSIPRVPTKEIFDQDQGHDKASSAEAEQTRQSKLKHAGSIQLKAITRELYNRMLNGNAKKFNSYTSLLFPKCVDNDENNTGKLELNSRGHSLDRFSHKRLKRKDAREIDFRSQRENKVLLKYTSTQIRSKDTEIFLSFLQDDDMVVPSKDNAKDREITLAKMHIRRGYMGETPVTLIL